MHTVEHTPTTALNGNAQERLRETDSERMRLGSNLDAKLLIVHADDLGMAHSVNEATFAAFEQGAVTSASVMVPCPWFAEVSAYACQHPRMDLGLHLTLTSEWQFYRWGSVAPRECVPSLHDSDGYFWNDSMTAAKMDNPGEVELEISHQLARAVQMGIPPSHIDSHMFSLFRSPALFSVYVGLARRHKLPFLSVRKSKNSSEACEWLCTDDIALDALFEANPRIPPQEWTHAYAQTLRSLKPGINQLIVHLGFYDSELRAITANRSNWDAAWRYRDFEFLTSPYFKELIEENQIHLASWNDLEKRVTPSATTSGFTRAPDKTI